MRQTVYSVVSFGLLLVATTFTAQAEKRVALVIGNSAYEQIAPLKNPKNDADAVAATLQHLGFVVIKGTDLTREKFAATVRDFSRALAGADAAVFFYAGHGLRVADRNYLAPTDAKLENEADLDFEMIEVDTILTQMEREPRVNIVFLDACRDNPLAQNLARSMGTRSSAIGRGLARIDTGIGTLIAFATQPGNVALDGEGEHSPFTQALLNHIETPGLDVAMLMRQVRQDVIAATSSRQVPWDHSSLTADFAFIPAPASEPVVAPDVKAPAPAPAAEAKPAPPTSAPDPALKRPDISLQPGQSVDIKLGAGESVDIAALPAPDREAQPAVPTRQTIEEFTNSYLRGDLSDVAHLRSLYADRVNYWDKGEVSVDEVITDKLAYTRKWPSLRYTLKPGTLKYERVQDGSAIYRVEFQYQYRATRGTKVAEGVGQAELVVDFSGDEPRIISEGGAVLSQNDGNSKR